MGWAELAVAPPQLGWEGERPLQTMEELCQQKVETLTQTCRLTATSLGVPSGTQGMHAQNQAPASLAGPDVHTLSSQGMFVKALWGLGSPLQVPRSTCVCTCPLRIPYVSGHNDLYTHTQAYKHYTGIF